MMKKVLVIGVSCSGKTTFARELSQKLNISFTDLDDLYWNPGWTITEPEIFLEKVRSVAQTDQWIIAGNYQSAHDLFLEDVDTFIWLDYSPFVVWKRAIFRTLRRAILKEANCNGNFESFRFSFLSKHSILLWVYKDFPRKRERYEKMINEGHFLNKNFLRFKTPKETKQFLETSL